MDLLRRTKYLLSAKVSSKTYWYLMGRLRPVPAVTSDFDTVDECLASGEVVVSLLDHLAVIHPQDFTLHIGSGLGRVEYHLRHRVAKCSGIDISSSMVRQARSLVPYENVEFVESDGARLSHWPDGRFNLVYSFLVFQHLPRPQFSRYIAEAYAKLSAGGYLVFQMLIDEEGERPDPPIFHPYGLRYYTRREVEECLRGSGFSQIKRTDLRGKADDGTAGTADVVFCAKKI